MPASPATIGVYCLSLLLLASAGWVGAAEHVAGPVIPPAGFEEGMGGWQVSHGRCAIDRSVAHAGAASLRIEDAGAATTGLLDLGEACWHLSFHIKTKDVTRGPEPWHRAGLQVATFDAERKALGHFDVGMTLGTTDWTRHERTLYFDPKEGVRHVKILLMNWNCTGTTWFDDVALVRAPIPEAYRKVPPLAAVENLPPRTWKQGRVLRAPVPEVPDEEFPLQAGRPAIRCPILPVRAEKREEGADIRRGYMTRRVRRTGPGAGPEGWLTEEYEERFRGSPIRSWFARLWLPNGERVGPVSFVVPLVGRVGRVRTFGGNRLVGVPRGDAVTLGPETIKPFVILSAADDDAGVILFHPIPPEVRRWHIEDYLVEKEHPARVTLSEKGELLYEFGDVETGPGGFCHSFDFHVFAMPYRGRFEDALKQFQLGSADLLSDALPFSANEPRGYWQPFMSDASGARLSRMARYFPREFASWMDSSGWDYGHKGGHGWGCTTATMKGIRVDPLAATALARDHAWRMLTFFLEAAGETGAPPNQYTWRAHAGSLKDPKEHYTTVFCQYWEWRVEEFRAWLSGSKLLTPGEKERIYQDLQRARKVYDPKYHQTAWTYGTPGGGCWFEYFDKPRGVRRWVINTHATSVGNVGDFALLAREMGKEDDYRAWRRLFERGVDGLIWVWEQPDMWTDYDPNEVRYARPPDGGPRGYHRYMVTSWTPKVVRLALEMDRYRLQELVKYWKRMVRAEYTTDSDRALIGPLLEKAEAAR